MAACGIAGQESPNGWIAIVLYLILAPAFWAYLQVSLNSVWEAEGRSLTAEAPVAA